MKQRKESHEVLYKNHVVLLDRTLYFHYDEVYNYSVGITWGNELMNTM